MKIPLLFLFLACQISLHAQAIGVGAPSANAGSVQGSSGGGVPSVTGTSGQVLINGGTSAVTSAATFAFDPAGTRLTGLGSSTAALSSLTDTDSGLGWDVTDQNRFWLIAGGATIAGVYGTEQHLGMLKPIVSRFDNNSGVTLGAADFRFYQGFFGANGISIGNATNPATITTSDGNANANLRLNPDGTGTITTTSTFGSYKNIATEGDGLLAIRKVGRITAQSGAATICTLTTPAADASYRVSANMLVNSAVAISTSINVSYTDEGNTARTMIMPLTGLAGTFVAGGLATTTGPFESATMHIRTKASSTITIAVASGTFTTVDYNAEAAITQIR